MAFCFIFRKWITRMILRVVLIFTHSILECVGRRFLSSGQKTSKPAVDDWFFTLQSYNSSSSVSIVIISVLSSVFCFIVIYQIIKLIRWCLAR